MSASASLLELQQHHLGEDEGTTMSSPTTQQLSQSEMTTPRMSKPKVNAKDIIVDCDRGMERTFSYSSVNTPFVFDTQQRLEPPAWKPPEQEEVEYTDAWNNVYNNQSHFLRPFPIKDDSTIGSTQTNNSLYNLCGTSHSSRGGGAGLRPRGFSLCSNNDSIEISSHSQEPSHRRYPSLPGSSSRLQPSGHRRHPSLPHNIFSSQLTQHPLLPPTIVSTQSTHQQHHYLQDSPRQHETHHHQAKTSHRIMKILQSSTQHTPYEMHSNHHTSQVQADAALAGLKGAFIDLYAVDRSVDTATATMLATKEEESSGLSPVGWKRKELNTLRTEQKHRKTAIGTLNDIQTILELYRVDKMADKFKVELQMPLFMEEEAWVHTVYKDLRRIDLEMELHSKRKNAALLTQKEGKGLNDVKNGEEYHFDLSESDEEGLGGEDIYMNTESFLTDDDAYHFIDPHEISTLQMNKYQIGSQVSASIHDDLRDVIELLKTDVEIDGASSRHAEIEMIRPLLEIDQQMNKWKERSELKGLWCDQIQALYAIDVEVGQAKTRSSSKQAKSGVSDVSETETDANSSQQVKDALSMHIPIVSKSYCQTSPEPVNVDSSSAPPPPPLPLPQVSRRLIFAPQEMNRTVVQLDDSTPKRSIFSQKEKVSAINAQRGGVMMPGTTTVVMTKGGEMIDDIPIGRVKFPGT